MTTEKEIRNNAFYHEICILRLLRDIGMLTQKEFAGIVKIAAEDYNANFQNKYVLTIKFCRLVWMDSN